MPEVASYQSVWGKCLQAIRDRIAALELGGVAAERIVIQKQPINRSMSNLLEGLPSHVADGSPAIVVTMSTERNLRRLPDQIARKEYGCPVFLFQSHEGEQAHLDSQLYQRERITNSFNQEPMPEVPTVIKTVVEPGGIFPRALYAQGFDGQMVTIRCHSCERFT